MSEEGGGPVSVELKCMEVSVCGKVCGKVCGEVCGGDCVEVRGLNMGVSERRCASSIPNNCLD